jgi:Transglycosylase associated protein
VTPERVDLTGGCLVFRTLEKRRKGVYTGPFPSPGDPSTLSCTEFREAQNIAGAFVTTYLGQAVGWYEAGEGAGFIDAVVGAVLILLTCRGDRQPGQRRA